VTKQLLEGDVELLTDANALQYGATDDEMTVFSVVLSETITATDRLKDFIQQSQQATLGYEPYNHTVLKRRVEFTCETLIQTNQYPSSSSANTDFRTVNEVTNIRKES
jgi:hypothetical protein